MAARPSKRGHGVEELDDLNLIPIMNLIVILIPALLLTSQFVLLAVINVSAPQIGSGVAQTKPPKHKPLNLTIAVTSKGFTIAGTGGVLGDQQQNGGPTIPKIGEKYDYKALTKKLSEIKDGVPDANKVIISADPDIQYSIIVKVMDASRTDNGKLLFPIVVLSAGIT